MLPRAERERFDCYATALEEATHNRDQLQRDLKSLLSKIGLVDYREADIDAVWLLATTAEKANGEPETSALLIRFRGTEVVPTRFIQISFAPEEGNPVHVDTYNQDENLWTFHWNIYSTGWKFVQNLTTILGQLGVIKNIEHELSGVDAQFIIHGVGFRKDLLSLRTQALECLDEQFAPIRIAVNNIAQHLNSS